MIFDTVHQVLTNYLAACLSRKSDTGRLIGQRLKYTDISEILGPCSTEHVTWVIRLNVANIECYIARSVYEKR